MGERMIYRKYRVWCKASQEMRYPDWIRFESTDSVAYGFSKNPHVVCYGLKRNVMESIGMQDYQDKDIYEGDILQSDIHQEKFYVKHFDAGYYLESLIYDHMAIKPVNKYWTHGDRFWVCGNIYQEKENERKARASQS